ncbi:hypothetical protein ALP74_200307 [Pseudomonas coronafaciens pv. garcae]|uniref:Uncharacterized protein n=1 Tax=Pseudomonas coronafaciens pv. garcae TaxID=251653 RepID=A0AB37QTW8_9PSED|nr:hypothetical protein ALP74_200307 [Pseudomonas coronafaciens pv. garcae]
MTPCTLPHDDLHLTYPESGDDFSSAWRDLSVALLTGMLISAGSPYGTDLLMLTTQDVNFSLAD